MIYGTTKSKNGIDNGVGYRGHISMGMMMVAIAGVGLICMTGIGSIIRYKKESKYWIFISV